MTQTSHHKDRDKDNLCQTLKLNETDHDILGKTLTIQNDTTFEQIVNPQMQGSKRISKKMQKNFRKKRVTIEVRNEDQ